MYSWLSSRIAKRMSARKNFPTHRLFGRRSRHEIRSMRSISALSGLTRAGYGSIGRSERGGTYALERRHSPRVRLAGAERAGRARDRTRLQRAALVFPLGQAAVENEHLVRAKKAKGPPHPRGREQRAGLVDDDRVGIGDAEGAHIARKLLRVRQHVGQRIGAVRNRIDVKADR